MNFMHGCYIIKRKKIKKFMRTQNLVVWQKLYVAIIGMLRSSAFPSGDKIEIAALNKDTDRDVWC